MILGFLLIAVGLVIIVGSIAAYGFFSENHGNRISLGKIMMSIVGVLFGVLVMYGALSLREVGAGQVGVIVRFGQVQGTLGPGLALQPWLIHDVVVMDTRVQNYNFGGETGIEAFTKENQTAFLFGVVNYHIDPQYAAELYQRVGVDYFEKVIRHQADTEVKRDSRLFTTDEITAKRDELAAGAQRRLTIDVAPYHIFIDGIYISQIGLPPSYLDSVNQKLIAEQNVQRAIFEADSAKQKAIGEANAQREAAAGEADATRTIAEGQRDANKAITSSLSDELIKWQSIQKLNPNVNVMLVPSDQGILFNLNANQPSPSPAP
jgi:regulator of protease activity HflC (stomatin/prohibitin superfamily)